MAAAGATCSLAKEELASRATYVLCCWKRDAQAATTARHGMSHDHACVWCAAGRSVALLGSMFPRRISERDAEGGDAP